MTGTALAAHNGNNKAELSGVGIGTAVVNYSEGQGTFNGTVAVSGLASNTSYSFYVTGAGAGAAGRLICSGTSDSSGMFTCSEQKLGLPGFTTAQDFRSHRMPNLRQTRLPPITAASVPSGRRAD